MKIDLEEIRAELAATKLKVKITEDFLALCDAENQPATQPVQPTPKPRRNGPQSPRLLALQRAKNLRALIAKQRGTFTADTLGVLYGEAYHQTPDMKMIISVLYRAYDAGDIMLDHKNGNRPVYRLREKANPLAEPDSPKPVAA